MKKFLLVLFIITYSFFAHSDELMMRLKSYCSSESSFEEFSNRNEIIVRLYPRTGIRGQYIVLESAKGPYPTNFPVNIKDMNNEGMVDPGKTILAEIYWGIPKKTDNFSIIKIDPNNCFIKYDDKNIDEKIKNLEDLNELDKAAASFNFEKAEKLIQEKNFKNSKGKYSWYSFSIFSEYRGDLAIAMLDNGFPAEEGNEKSAIISAVLNSSIPLAEKAISLKGNVNFTYPYNGVTPLILAVMTSDLPMIRLLIKSGAKVKPGPPFNHNPLCYIGGMQNISGNVFRSHIKPSREIAEVLLNAGANPNEPCNAQNPQPPISVIGKDVFLDVVKLLIKHGLKVNQKDLGFGIESRTEVLLSQTGYQLVGQTKASYEEYQQQKNKDLPIHDQEQMARVVKNAIRFDDFDLFQKSINHSNIQTLLKVHPPVKKNSDYCISGIIAYAEPKYFKELIKIGLTSDVKCSEEYQENLFNYLVGNCRYDLINLIPQNELKGIKIDNKIISDFFRDIYSSDPDYQFKCMNLLSTLSQKKIPFEKQFALRKMLEAENTSLLDFSLNEKIFEDNLLFEAGQLYKNDKNLFPIDEESSSLSIPRSNRDYFLYRIIPITEKRASSPTFKLTPGVRYPLCGIHGEVGLFKRKVESYPLFFLPQCNKLTSSNMTHYELYEEKDGFLALIAITDNYYGEPPIMGSKYYLNPRSVTTPFYLTDGKHNLPLRLAGLSKVIIQNGQFSETGEEDICKSSKTPTIASGELSGIITNLPVDFDISKARILKNINQDISQICSNAVQANQ